MDVGVPITDATNVAFEVTDIDRVEADLPKKIKFKQCQWTSSKAEGRGTCNCHPKPDISFCESVPEKVLILLENFLDFVEGIKDLFDTLFIGILTRSEPGPVDPI